MGNLIPFVVGWETQGLFLHTDLVPWIQVSPTLLLPGMLHPLNILVSLCFLFIFSCLPVTPQFLHHCLVFLPVAQQGCNICLVSSILVPFQWGGLCVQFLFWQDFQVYFFFFKPAVGTFPSLQLLCLN